jgi:hypothetical protein
LCVMTACRVNYLLVRLRKRRLQSEPIAEAAPAACGQTAFPA